MPKGNTIAYGKIMLSSESGESMESLKRLLKEILSTHGYPEQHVDRKVIDEVFHEEGEEEKSEEGEQTEESEGEEEDKGAPPWRR